MPTVRVTGLVTGPATAPATGSRPARAEDSLIGLSWVRVSAGTTARGRTRGSAPLAAPWRSKAHAPCTAGFESLDPAGSS
eukprot:scaffold442_cov268-Pinguiococcus_pyrenoidosus.AAC.99